ncbi:hypothetical protein DM992_24985 [Burkholderia sp. JP2-270]|nr:hypothetical protein DM992_24985 [Burkholderia sp. JP2-270]
MKEALDAESSPETLSLPTAQQSTLADVMAGATFSEEVIRDGGLPVMMMLHQHALTAFPVDAQANYQSLYEAFKNYLKNTAQWSTKDAAFVWRATSISERSTSFVLTKTWPRAGPATVSSSVAYYVRRPDETAVRSDAASSAQSQGAPLRRHL